MNSAAVISFSKFKKNSLSSITKSQSQTKLCPVALFKSNNEKEKKKKRNEKNT